MTNPLYANEYVPAVGDSFEAFNRRTGWRHRYGPFKCSFAGKRVGKRCVEGNNGEHRLWLDTWRFEKVEE